MTKNKQKLWLCGITQNEEKNIEELTKDYDLFDGLNFVDGGSTDKTVEILESRKKDGKIIHRAWSNDFDFQFNEIFRQGNMNHGDWFVLLDSRERVNTEFVKNLRGLTQDFNKENISLVYQRSKPFLFKYSEYGYFLGNPHWGPRDFFGKSIDYSKIEPDDKKYVYSLRNKDQNFIVNGLKYYLFYSRSNHLLLVYSPEKYGNYDKYTSQEQLRMRFREEYRDLGFSFSLDGFLEFCEKLPENCVHFFEKELVLSNAYRYYIFNDDPKTIKDQQFTYNLTEDPRFKYHKPTK